MVMHLPSLAWWESKIIELYKKYLFYKIYRKIYVENIFWQQNRILRKILHKSNEKS